MYLLQHETEGLVGLTDGFAGLARRLNISRTTLYRSMAELEQMQIISHFEKTIAVLDVQRLYGYVQSQSDIPSILE